MPIRIEGTPPRRSRASEPVAIPLETIPGRDASDLENDGDAITAGDADPGGRAARTRARQKPPRKSKRKLGPVGNHAIGDRKPDPRFQWKKGQSGNPRGPRKKEKEKQKTIEQMVAEAFFQPGGRLADNTPVSALEVLLRATVRDAIKDGGRKRSEALALAFKHLPSQELVSPDAPLTEQEISLFNRLKGLSDG